MPNALQSRQRVLGAGSGDGRGMGAIWLSDGGSAHSMRHLTCAISARCCVPTRRCNRSLCGSARFSHLKRHPGDGESPGIDARCAHIEWLLAVRHAGNSLPILELTVRGPESLTAARDRRCCARRRSRHGGAGICDSLCARQYVLNQSIWQLAVSAGAITDRGAERYSQAFYQPSCGR